MLFLPQTCCCTIQYLRCYCQDWKLLQVCGRALSEETDPSYSHETFHHWQVGNIHTFYNHHIQAAVEPSRENSVRFAKHSSSSLPWSQHRCPHCNGEGRHCESAVLLPTACNEASGEAGPGEQGGAGRERCHLPQGRGNYSRGQYWTERGEVMLL